MIIMRFLVLSFKQINLIAHIYQTPMLTIVSDEQSEVPLLSIVNFTIPSLYGSWLLCYKYSILPSFSLGDARRYKRFWIPEIPFCSSPLPTTDDWSLICELVASIQILLKSGHGEIQILTFISIRALYVMVI